MKPQLLDELKKEYEVTHGCYRPSGGPCFYIASRSVSSDFGRRTGRRFFAAIEQGNGTLHIVISLTFLVTKMAHVAKANVIQGPDQFCREVGLERLRETLDRDSKTEGCGSSGTTVKERHPHEILLKYQAYGHLASIMGMYLGNP